jgi:hypothetical protein
MDLQTLVDEYNATELQQTARLRAIFAQVKARKGYRHILFNQGGDMLNNCWDMPNERLDDETYLKKYNREISEVIPGEE